MNVGDRWITVAVTPPNPDRDTSDSFNFAQNYEGVRLEIDRITHDGSPLNCELELLGWLEDEEDYDHNGLWAKFQKITLINEFQTMLLPLTGDYQYISDFPFIAFRLASGDPVRVRLIHGQDFYED